MWSNTLQYNPEHRMLLKSDIDKFSFVKIKKFKSD